MKWFSEYMMAACDADKTIVAANGDTYIGKMDREIADFNSSTPIEQQPVWQIKKIEQTTSGGNTIYKTLFPKGDRRYIFAMTDALTLTYNYSVN